jgi:hypothetical protein
VVIGKGGMGAKTLAGLKESGAVYLNAVGGAAQFYARCIERVEGVSLMEFGTPEARQQPAQGRRAAIRAAAGGDGRRLVRVSRCPAPTAITTNTKARSSQSRARGCQ